MRLANENVSGVPAANLNNANIKMYADAMKEIAAREKVGFVDVYDATLAAMADKATDLTINGVHLSADGYALLALAYCRPAVAKD